MAEATAQATMEAATASTAEERLPQIQSNKSLIWTRFTKQDCGKGKCNFCQALICCTDGNTTGMVRHLASKHKKEHNAYVEETKKRDEEKKRKREENLASNPAPSAKRPVKDFFKPVVTDKDLSDKFNDVLIDHIADNHCSYRQFGGKTFKKMMSIANRRITVKNPKTLSLHCWAQLSVSDIC